MYVLENLDLDIQARYPNGIDYSCADIRYPGWFIPVANMSERDPDSYPHRGYDDLILDRRIPRPELPERLDF